MLRVDPADLVFPCGVAPGFDPTHIAGAKVRFSGIALPPGFINLLSGAAGANVGTAPTAVINGTIGPATTYTGVNGSSGTNFAGNPAVTDASLTFAAIFIVNNLSATFNSMISGGTAGSSNFMALNGSNQLVLARFGGTTNNSSLLLSAGVPYYAAVSNNGTTGINYILARLDNGKILTATSGSGANLASNGTYVIGNDPQTIHAGALQGAVAAAMISAQFTSMAVLQAWAADPWSFWYPKK